MNVTSLKDSPTWSRRTNDEASGKLFARITNILLFAPTEIGKAARSEAECLFEPTR
jgi:hypothetical protein